MKFLTLIITLFSINVFAVECKINRTDGIILFGHCLKQKNVVIFKSCAGFTCLVNQKLTRSLDIGDSVCENKSNILEESLTEHQVKDVKKIPFCSHSE